MDYEVIAVISNARNGNIYCMEFKIGIVSLIISIKKLISPWYHKGSLRGK